MGKRLAFEGYSFDDDKGFIGTVKIKYRDMKGNQFLLSLSEEEFHAVVEDNHGASDLILLYYLLEEGIGTVSDR